jgi:hypothetical protein
MDPDAFGPRTRRFHEQLVALAGNQTLEHRRRDAERDPSRGR